MKKTVDAAARVSWNQLCKNDSLLLHNWLLQLHAEHSVQKLSSDSVLETANMKFRAAQHSRKPSEATLRANFCISQALSAQLDCEKGSILGKDHLYY